jgi:hypothetical protein
MSRRAARIWFSVFAALVISFMTVHASALPAFARRYHAACTTCHVQFPKLNTFGEAFRRNGYQFPAGGDADEIKQEPITLVGEARRDALPDSDFPTDLPAFPPLAFVVNGFVPVFPDAASRPEGEKLVSFDRMYAQAQLFAGVRVGEDVSVFAGVNLATNSAVQLERGFIVFSNLFGPSVLGVRVGQFEPQVASFSSYRRIAGPAYMILNDPVAPASFALEPVVRGVDLSGTLASGRLGWNVAWVQGVEAPNYGGEKARQMPLDGYAHLVTRIGGMRLDAADAREGGARDDFSVDIGGFAYAGQHDVDADNNASTPPEGDVVTKLGGDALARLGRVELLAAGAWERHRFDVAPAVSRWQALGEASVRVFPWLVALVRGESDVAPGLTRRRMVPAVSVHPRLNIKLQVYGLLEDDLTAHADSGFAFHEVDVGGSYAF